MDSDLYGMAARIVTLEPMDPDSSTPQNDHQPELEPFQKRASDRKRSNIMPITRKTPGTTFIAKKPFAQWYTLMKTYNKKNEEKCKIADELKDRDQDRNEVKHFVTGSSYNGAVGMTGYGEYTFPNGVVYQGNFRDGCFHGDGKLRYNHSPEAFSVIQGQWFDGVLEESKILFDGKLEYDEHDWMYCKIPDRRYTMEFEKDLYFADEPHLTPENPPRTIPPGCYDTGDGFYRQQMKLIYKHGTECDVQRAPSVGMQKWIKDNCRKEPVETLGPRQALYEKWVDPVVVPEPLPEPSIGFHKWKFNPSAADQETVTTGEDYDPVVYDPKLYL